MPDVGMPTPPVEQHGRDGAGSSQRRICLNCRLTPFEKETIKARADALGLTVTDYVVRQCVYVNEDMPDAGMSDAELLECLRGYWRELASQGTNLNQIAMSANKIALDTRSASSRQLARTLNSLAESLKPGMVELKSEIAEVFDRHRVRRR